MIELRCDEQKSAMVERVDRVKNVETVAKLSAPHRPPSSLQGGSSLRLFAPLGVLLVLTACGQPDNPQLAMCQSVGSNLLGGASWGEHSVTDNPNRMSIKLEFKTESAGAGTIQCVYPRERTDDGNGRLATAPESVLINGERVSTRDLIAAGTRASATELKKVADETRKQSTELARETGRRAGELAEQAGQSAEEFAAEAGVRAEELAGQAGELAGQAGERAREVLQDATRKLQQSLDNN